MARTFVPITGSGGSGSFVAGSKWGYQTAEKVRQGLDVANYAGYHADFGGDNIAGTTSTSFTDVNSRRLLNLNGDNFGGLDVEAVVSYRSGAAGTTVAVQVWNDTDSIVVPGGTSATSTSTGITDETLTLTMPSGNKNLKLRFMSGGGSNDPVFAWGYLRARETPV